MDLEKESLVQEYVTNPFLIDGRKFSVGIFVTFVSTNPTRAYLLHHDVGFHLRFAEKAYYPVDYTDPATYVTDGSEIYDLKRPEFVSSFSLRFKLDFV